MRKLSLNSIKEFREISAILCYYKIQELIFGECLTFCFFFLQMHDIIIYYPSSDLTKCRILLNFFLPWEISTPTVSLLETLDLRIDSDVI